MELYTGVILIYVLNRSSITVNAKWENGMNLICIRQHNCTSNNTLCIVIYVFTQGYFCFSFTCFWNGYIATVSCLVEDCLWCYAMCKCFAVYFLFACIVQKVHVQYIYKDIVLSCSLLWCNYSLQLSLKQNNVFGNMM